MPSKSALKHFTTASKILGELQTLDSLYLLSISFSVVTIYDNIVKEGNDRFHPTS